MTIKTTREKPRYIIGKFNITGGNKINTDLVCEKWNHLWCISRWHNKFRLIKGVRKDSELLSFKTTISSRQAKELIKELGLIELKSTIFTHAGTFRKKGDFRK